MKNENEVNYPSTGASTGFALGFLIFYIVVVFSVLGLFFKIPF
ncbi:MAG TPA: hypothetical protein PK605_10310 [Ignavibacteria bacterium]|nr:hypothetical protein [Ignavibacteria bacterium]HRF67002.1 hypothetical protein [Ignavibacteria bacterium]HRJ04781.1 hypothetical protein [Ignavibacteria bacterium]HRJ86274.1 hypothetical protein [Ignavibacteria bacterium]